MKPSVAPTNGEVVETTTRRRVIPVDLASDSKTPECWEYLAQVEQKNEWANHIVYIHRTEPTPTIPVQKCTQHLVAPNGIRIPIWDREELEFGLLNYFGGGRFRFLVKRGPMIITKGELFIDAPSRAIQAPPQAPASEQPTATTNPMFVPGDATASIAAKAIDTVAGAEHQAVNIGLNAMATAANVIKSFAGGGQQDDFTKQMMVALLNRVMTPPPDPLAQMVQIITVLKELNTLSGNGADPRMGKLLDTAIERFLNPSSGSAPSSTMGEVLRQAPGLISGFAEVMREQRLIAEAQANAAIAQSSVPRPSGPNPQLIPPTSPAGPQVAPQQTGAPSMEFVEKKILEIFQQNVSAEQAADDAMAFLSGLDQKACDQLAALGETGLVQFFANRPILKAATGNMPRLIEFIRAFLRMHAEDVAQAASAAQPVQPAKPPLPN